MPPSPATILISAGEASGDRLGAGLARALLEQAPGTRLVGMGSRLMAEAGVEIVQDASEVAVVGLTEVLRHLGRILRALKRMERVLDQERPAAFVPVDFPDFHFRLAARARRRGIPVIYFVSPQVWAWRRGRIRTLARLVRRMLVLFPFEEALYREAGVPVTFVGHPLAELGDPRGEGRRIRESLGLESAERLVALLPGSRPSEVGHVLPVLSEAARRLARERPGTRFLVPEAETLPPGYLESMLNRYPVPGARRVPGGRLEWLAACDAGAVASGTATLEAAVAGLPMVVVYRMSPVTYALGRLMVRVDHVAMANVVAQKRLVPELIQGECTPERVAGALLELLRDPAKAEAMRRGLEEVRRALGPPGIYRRAAAAVLAEIGAAGRVEPGLAL